jgi:WD40 repeat protein
MAEFQQQPPTRIKLRRDAIIHAIAFTDDFYAVGDDEALTVFDARTDRALRRFEDIGTVLSVCFVGDRVAAGTLHGVVALRPQVSLNHETWDNLSLAPASSEREGVRAIAATGTRLAAGDAAGRVRVWYCGEAAAQPLFALKAAKDRTCAVEALALQDTSLVVARSALGSTQVPLLSVWTLHESEPPEVSWSSDEEEDGDASDDGDEFDPWHPTLSQRLVVNPSTATVDVHAVARSDTVLVAGASDGSVTAWDAATFAVRWRGNVFESVQAIALAAGRIIAVPIGVGAAAAPIYIRNGEIADCVALAPPARKPIGGNNCDGCGTPALVWDGSVQQGCPVCSAGTVVNACALARDGNRLLAGGYDRSLHAWDLSDLDNARS